MNPYESPQTASGFKRRAQIRGRDMGTIALTTIFVIAAVVSGLEIIVPAVRAFAMPRFGWAGLMVVLNPLIFLTMYLAIPKTRNLLAAAMMCCVVGIVNANQLLGVETVAVVKDIFHERLHSSWAWSVVPFFVAATYLVYVAIRDYRKPTKAT